MGTISLEGIEFFGHHGHTEAERALGNRYTVDLLVSADLNRAARTDKLDYTIDYEQLYQIVREESDKPAHLLEHLCGRILDRLIRQFPQILEAEICVKKHNPSFGGLCQTSSVRMRRRPARTA